MFSSTNLKIRSILHKKWKISNITPIFKNGEKTDISNYRGISNLSSIPKLFELMVCNQLEFQTKSIISSSQHGFMKGRSTVTNLVEFTRFTCERLETREQVDTVYTDFTKAFDSINHKIITYKLRCIGFDETLLRWINTYLEERVQRVVIGGAVSKSICVSSGVPQGSHLGPLIFLLFLDDIIKVIKHSECLMYADDLKIFKAISSEQDCVALQSDINAISQWCDTYRLKLNLDKCKVMSFYRKRHPIINIYTVVSQPLIRVGEIVDLGVTFCSNLSFNLHMDKIINKSISMLGFIIRLAKDFKNTSTLITLYNSYVRSVLEYACVVWNPLYSNYSDYLEQVQKRFIFYLFRKFNLVDNNLQRWEQYIALPPYNIRCKMFKLQLLSDRRIIASIMFVADLVEGRYNAPNILNNLKLVVPSRTLRINEVFKVYFHKTNYGLNEPITRMVKLCNHHGDLFDYGVSKGVLKKILKYNIGSECMK